MRRPEVLLRFAARFLLYFLPLALLWFLVAPFYSDLIFSGVNLLFQLDQPPVARVSRTGDAIYAYHLKGTSSEPAVQFKLYGLFFNAVLLMSLVLAAPGLGWGSRLARLAIAASLLGVVHVLFVVFQVKAQFVNAGILAVSSESAYWHNWLAALFGTVGEAFFPLLIAGVLSWRAWARALDLHFIKVQTVESRNAPCPCGSGKKYKHCCGRA
jgi:hypothetical protein